MIYLNLTPDGLLLASLGFRLLFRAIRIDIAVILQNDADILTAAVIQLLEALLVQIHLPEGRE